ncbi:hypothetical protein TUM12370_29760 [Salmonella enterica subsp. enterica serovar Choleraesuis]|nr:hypothetical protein TUM12370_29760 [Salmonella enterica subsp. enterica serovar Choleraesuis]
MTHLKTVYLELRYRLHRQRKNLAKNINQYCRAPLDGFWLPVIPGLRQRWQKYANSLTPGNIVKNQG